MNITTKKQKKHKTTEYVHHSFHNLDQLQITSITEAASETGRPKRHITMPSCSPKEGRKQNLYPQKNFQDPGTILIDPNDLPQVSRNLRPPWNLLIYLQTLMK
jgi:hypothetical protein